ncbi:MAG: MATE family efflux transporter [Clostridia bacterium]|nr:MATE family efflux transporter [Clostridia bacterium]
MLFTKKDIFKILIPLLIEQFLTVSIGMIDSMMVSSAGEAAISGVSLVDSLNLLLVYIFSALSGGGAVVISQFIGKKDVLKTEHASKLLVWVVFVVSLVITIVAVCFRRGLLSLVFGSVESHVMSNALVYFLYTALSYPFLALYGAVSAIFRSMGNTRISLVVSLIKNLINVAGNAILIFEFNMGAAGAAIATLFSRVIGAAIMMVCLHGKRNMIHIDNIFKVKFDFSIVKRICAIGIPNGLENGMFQFGKVLTQSLVATFATVYIAANSAANSITSIQYVIGAAVSLTMVTVVGRCIGAGDRDGAKNYAKMLIKIEYCLIFVLTGSMMIFVKPIVSLYNLSPESSQFAITMILIHSVGNCTVWPVAFTLPASFRASSDVRYPMIISIFSMWTFRVGMSYMLCKGFGVGIMGIWYAMMADWIFRAVVYVVRFKRGTWMMKYSHNDKH